MIVTVVGFGMLGGMTAAGFRVNDTASMPRGLWRIVRTRELIKRGSVVSACLPAGPMARLALRRRYVAPGFCPLGTESVLKPVVAVAGDVVRVTAAGIAVNGTLLPNSRGLWQDSAGRPLRPVPPGTYRVGPGEVWLVSSYAAKSFDSRYFGAVLVADIQGLEPRACPRSRTGKWTRPAPAVLDCGHDSAARRTLDRLQPREGAFRDPVRRARAIHSKSPHSAPRAASR